ncbi:PD-(D/E)XK motif protein [Kribbella sp. NPDC051770]|uniref:PD-(D/E)XK motif protein n=1 Tax=Kribbella sp. NPDC051770 TaxID=3155413 RepID=UPI00341D0A56
MSSAGSTSADQVTDVRHLSVANIDAVWSSGHPVVLPIVGTPACELVIHPAHGTITLITDFEPPEPDVAKWRNITFNVASSDGGDLAELSVSVEGNVHGAYGLLTSVADRLQLQSEPLAAAAAFAVTKHRMLFAGEARLSVEKELGLFGELLVLEYLIEKIGAGAAIASWQGPLSEEHDFVFGHVHLEVKSTSSERRRHMMHGLRQLVPLRNVPLSLVSIQLTRSNHEGGLTLGQLISRVRTSSGAYRPAVDTSLEALGWDDAHGDLYTTFWTTRNTPRAFDINEQFPALTTARLDQVVPHLDLIGDLAYRVDLTYSNPDPLPEPLADLVAFDEELS